MNENNLSPCPFCANPDIRLVAYFDTYAAWCIKCNVRIECTTPEAAAEAWNNRNDTLPTP